MDIGEPSDLPKTQTHREVATAALLERAIPMAVIDRDRADLDPMFARVGDDLRGRIKAHRLRVKQRRAEDVGMMMLHPAGSIGDLREACRVAFRKAIGAEPLDLLEGALGKVARISSR